MDKIKLFRLNPIGNDSLLPTNQSIHGVIHQGMNKIKLFRGNPTFKFRYVFDLYLSAPRDSFSKNFDFFFIDLVNRFSKKISHNQETMEDVRRRMTLIPGL